ncbi:ciliogenesis and planar polarity effector 1-like isoform X1 [Haliotis asinina]|uniref:ciliogenesis and planar polarity effector 1-like isoform X1 n=1 Tax=Haliotis asinina TaxID=109174 RepID=UPI003531C89A
MKDCGIQNADRKSGSCYWVSSMSWTCDNLFLACILRNGSVCLVSRLGEPITIQTSGNSIDLGPSRFIPIHPVIRVQQDSETEPVLDEHGDDPLQQIFSVSTHPSLPIILFTDGYMVTVVQLPCETRCMAFMRDLVFESSKHLKWIQEQEGIDLTLASPYNLPVDKAEQDKMANRKRERMLAESKSKPQRLKNLHYSFEELTGSLNDTQDSEVSVVLDDGFGQFGAMQNLSSGKIMFGEPEMMLATVDSSYLSMAEQEAVAKRMQAAKVALFMSWKLAASHSDIWTSDLDRVAKSIAQNMIRMFSLILNCQPVSEMINPSIQSPAIQNGGLFQVMTMYRQMLDLLQFDVLHQHLIPVSIQLMHHTAKLVLESSGLDQLDPRLKTLSGCYTLLRFSEKTFNKTYVWLPKSVSSKPFTPRSGLGGTDQYQQGRIDGVDNTAASQLLSKRLSASWMMLYKNLVHFQTHQCQSEAEYRQAQSIMCQIQETMQHMETPIPQQLSPRISHGDKHSLDGHHTQAVNAWSKQLKAIGAKEDSNKAARLLHSLLYTYLIRGELLTAVDFVDSLILRANVPVGVDPEHLNRTTSSDSRLPLMTIVATTLKTLAFDSPDMVPCIRDKSIRQLVQTMARFMAAYFSNQTVYIFPPHNPQPLPAIHFHAAVVNNRIIPQYHEDITGVIRQHKLGSVWTVERTLEYLLLSGLACEATWFADKMGDWKAAFLMAVGCVQHHFTAPKVYEKKRKPLTLPDSLLPGNILERKLGILLGETASEAMSKSRQLTQDYVAIDEETNLKLLTKTLEDILTGAMVGRVDVLPGLLRTLVEKLKNVVSELPPLVPKDFYLPAPPLYCPQPSATSQESMRSTVGLELAVRRKAASLIQLMLSFLQASHLSLHVTHWYVVRLLQAQHKATQFKANTEGPCTELPEFLSGLLDNLSSELNLEEHEDVESVQSVLSSFRDVCSVVWMLHARDKLSLCLRQRQKYLDQLSFRGQGRENGSERWLQECFTNLQWAVHLLAFSRFLPDEGCVYKVILSLLLELPPSEDTADILAEYFYDMENLDAEVQEKVDKILHEWQTVIVKPEDDGRSAKVDADVDDDDPTDGRKSVTFYRASPRGKSLSAYFHKQCQVAGKVLKKRRICFGNYGEFVFPNSSKKSSDLNIGSRPFETKRYFIEFMDTFCSVSFGRLMESELEKHIQKRYPVLLPWADVIMNREMTTFLERSSHGNKKHSLVVLTPRDGSVETLPRGKDSSVYRRKGSVGDSDHMRLMKAKGLFRSKSVVEMGSSDKPSSPVRRYESENGIDELVGTPARSSRQGSQQNLSELASRFYQSEEALYPQEDNDHFWTLNVNFGRRYTPLKNQLEWLESWSRKPHSLGLGKKETHFDLKPTMKISIPAHLILLSLWLLENKYTANQQPLHRSEVEDTKTGGHRSRSRRRLTDNFEFNNNASNPPGGMTRSSVSPRGKSPSRESLGVRTLSRSPQGRDGELKSSAVLDVENMNEIYKQVLDSRDDSSSIDVSSLASDELEGGHLSIIKGTGSPQRGSVSLLNRTIQLPAQALQQPLNSSLVRSSSSRGSHRGGNFRSPRQSPSSTTRSRKGRSPSPVLRESDSARQSGGSAVSADLASQLQNIVRSEMRRIMEVQHRSLMAMMGAIDGPDAESHPITPQHQAPSHGSQDRPVAVDDLHHSQQPPIRGVLREMRNLRTTTEHSQSGRSPGKENSLPLGISDLRHSADSSFPKFLRIPAERDMNDGFKLPHIPMSAWNDPTQQHEKGVPQMPLLHLNQAPSSFFQGLQKTSPGQFPINPPPYDHSSSNQFPSSHHGHLGMPLLKMSKQEPAFLNIGRPPAFGRLVPPEYVIGHHQEIHQRELEKQSHLEEFHRQYIKEQTEMDKQRFGQQLLSVKRVQDSLVTKKSPRRVRKVKSPPEKPAAQSVFREELSPERQMEEKTEEKMEEKPQQEEVESKEEEESLDTEEDDSGQEIDDGYALRPGAFDAYLHLGRALGVRDDSAAGFQYQLAMKMKEQQTRRRRKVDFATMTKELFDGEMLTDPAMEVVRTAEAATSITRDTGVDPIQEALIEYNQAMQGTVVPPDVFLGLRFRDEEPQPGSEGAPAGKGPGRSYLNVVDIRASAVMKDLNERPSEERIQPDVSLKPSSISATMARRMGQTMDAVEEGLREDLEPPRRYHHDAVTVRMFESRQAGEDRASVALMPRGSMRESKVAMIRRLREMNEQMRAIDEMSNNMESDFMNTHLMLNTLDAMVDAAHPSAQREVTSDSRSSSPLRDSKEGRVSGRLTPKSSQRSPQPSARSTQSKKSTRTSADASHMSGLSGISDIIGEVIADGGVDLAEAGITTAEAEMLAYKAKGSAAVNERVRMSVEKLKQIVTQAHENANQDDVERRRELQDWMAEKYSERQREFLRHRAELREREVSPFKPSNLVPEATLRSKALQEAEKERTAFRKNTGKENMDRRFEEAEMLLGDILVDKPCLPKEQASRKAARKVSPKRTSSLSPKRPSTLTPKIKRKTSPPRPGQKVLQPTLTDASPTLSLRSRNLERTRVIQTDLRRSRSPDSPTRKGILKTSDNFEERPGRRDDVLTFSEELLLEQGLDSDFDRTGGSTADLLSYARHVEEMDEKPLPFERYSKSPTSEPKKDNIPVKPYKPKSFTELVRLQHPEKLRKGPVKRSGPSYTERLSSMSRQNTARDSTTQEKEKLYGSKHIPGTARKADTGPRRVKTYAERLQEMKPRRQYSTPVVPRQHVPESVRTHSTGWQGTYRKPTPTGPKHKPQTYVEQLKKLNASSTSRRTLKGGKTVTIQPRTFMKARKPAHPAKNYVEQLQDINAQAPETLRRAAQSRRYPTGRDATRPRPYSTPYRSMEEDIAEGWETRSEISDWVMEDDVRQLLYADDDTSVVYTVGGTASALDYPMSDGRSDYYNEVMGEDDYLYANSVDVGEIWDIADAASIGSGSVASVIDWDAVDRLIADEDDI